MINLESFEPIGRRRKVGLTYDLMEKRFVLSFDPDISKTELLEAWNRFEKARKKVSGKSYYKKGNTPSDIDLLLGVQVFRYLGITFKQIHNIYANKQDKHYSGDYKFLTEFDLQKYYDRNIKKI